MLPSRPLDFVTPAPVVDRLEYPTTTGMSCGDVYRPASRGRHPGIVVCLGVVPFGVDHPQVPRLGAALARAGFAALLYWSSAMRDFRLDPEDIHNIALSYDQLLQQPYVDGQHSGLIGTCVGGSFALMASADGLIRDRVAFVAAFAPYGSLPTLARDILSGTRARFASREPWQVDPLTRKVFVHSLTARLEADEARRLRDAFLSRDDAGSPRGLSADGRAVNAVLAARTAEEADIALARLPEDLQAGLRICSPVNHLHDIGARLIAISHDRDDAVIPVSESRLLRSALAQRPGVRYAEFAMFEHADPTKRKLSPARLVRQLGRFYLWLHAIFRSAVP